MPGPFHDPLPAEGPPLRPAAMKPVTPVYPAPVQEPALPAAVTIIRLLKRSSFDPADGRMSSLDARTVSGLPKVNGKVRAPPSSVMPFADASMPCLARTVPPVTDKP